MAFRVGPHPFGSNGAIAALCEASVITVPAELGTTLFTAQRGYSPCSAIRFSPMVRERADWPVIRRVDLSRPLAMPPPPQSWPETPDTGDLHW